jgi:hypothetical protein
VKVHGRRGIGDPEPFDQESRAQVRSAQYANRYALITARSRICGHNCLKHPDLTTTVHLDLRFSTFLSSIRPWPFDWIQWSGSNNPKQCARSNLRRSRAGQRPRAVYPSWPDRGGGRKVPWRHHGRCTLRECGRALILTRLCAKLRGESGDHCGCSHTANYALR